MQLKATYATASVLACVYMFTAACIATAVVAFGCRDLERCQAPSSSVPPPASHAILVVD